MLNGLSGFRARTAKRRQIIMKEEVLGASVWGQTTLGPGQAPLS